MIANIEDAKARAEIAATYTANYYKRLEMVFGPEKAQQVFHNIGRDTETGKRFADTIVGMVELLTGIAKRSAEGRRFRVEN